jgi:hypothetical protein
MNITKSEANHLKNLCKELADKYSNNMQSLKVYNNTMTLLSSGTSYQTVVGDTIDFNNLRRHIFSICDLFSFSAYLGEEIKRLEKAEQEIKLYGLINYVEDNNITIPESPKYIEYTEEQAIKDMDEADRAQYYGLEAQVAHIGKALHTGVLYNIKQQIKSIKSSPCDISGTGNDTIVNKRELSIDPEVFTSFYFDMQNKYRELQKNLNYLKASIKNKVNEENTKRLEAYNAIISEHRALNQELYAKLEACKLEKLSALSKQRITVPECYNAVYNHINNLGK